MLGNPGDEALELEQDAEMLERRKKMGAFIRARREAMKINRPRFEALSGVHQKFLSSIEGGHTSCSLETLTAVAKGLGVPVATLASVYAGEHADLNSYILKSVTLPDILEPSDIENVMRHIDLVVAARERANMVENDKLVSARKERQAKKAAALRDVKKIENAGSN